ncbi:inner membrane CreD family protein, partial [Streptomyces niveiscabiei]
ATADLAAREIGNAWGREQVVGGPVLMVPYLVPPKNAVSAPTREVAVFLPDDLQASSEAQTEIRRRSIFDVPVYRGKVGLNARFL